MNRAWDGLLEARHFRLETMGRSTGYLGGSFNEGKGQFEKEAIRTALAGVRWERLMGCKRGFKRTKRGMDGQKAVHASFLNWRRDCRNLLYALSAFGVLCIAQ